MKHAVELLSSDKHLASDSLTFYPRSWPIMHSDALQILYSQNSQMQHTSRRITSMYVAAAAYKMKKNNYNWCRQHTYTHIINLKY